MPALRLFSPSPLPSDNSHKSIARVCPHLISHRVLQSLWKQSPQAHHASSLPALHIHCQCSYSTKPFLPHTCYCQACFTSAISGLSSNSEIINCNFWCHILSGWDKCIVPSMYLLMRLTPRSQSLLGDCQCPDSSSRQLSGRAVPSLGHMLAWPSRSQHLHTILASMSQEHNGQGHSISPKGSFTPS